MVRCLQTARSNVFRVVLSIHSSRGVRDSSLSASPRCRPLVFRLSRSSSQTPAFRSAASSLCFCVYPQTTGNREAWQSGSHKGPRQGVMTRIKKNLKQQRPDAEPDWIDTVRLNSLLRVFVSHFRVASEVRKDTSEESLACCFRTVLCFLGKWLLTWLLLF